MREKISSKKSFLFLKKHRVLAIFVFIIFLLASYFISYLIILKRRVPENATLKERISFSQMKQDCKILEKILTECYIGTYTFENNEMKAETISNEIIDQMKNKKQNDGLFMVHDFENIIFSVLEKFFKTQDAHFGIVGYEEHLFVKHSFLFYSEFLFEKQGTDFFVVHSPNEGIISGAKYTGLKTNLFREVVNGKEFYRFGVFSNQNIRVASLSINNEKFIVPVSRTSPGLLRTGQHKFFETDETFYIALGDFSTNDVKNDFSVVNDKSNVIFDLRGNFGGYNEVTGFFLSELFFSKDESIKNKFMISFSDIITTDTLTSSYILQATENYMKRENISYNQKQITFAKLFPRNIKLKNEKNILLSEYKAMTNFNGNLFILMDELTASSAELFIATALFLANKNVFLIGKNSLGAVEYGACFDYFLPNSGINFVRIGAQKNSDALLNYSDKFMGEGKGFIPDYWIFESSIIDLLLFLTNDKNISSLRDLG